VDPSTSQIRTPSSSTRLTNIPKEAVEKASKSLRRIISPTDDDNEILDSINVVRTIIKDALQKDPELKKRLASEEEFRANVTKKGEKTFIDSLRAMAANSNAQGSKAWEDLFEDGTSFSLIPRHSDLNLRLDVFLKEAPPHSVGSSHETTTSEEGTYWFQCRSTLF
jgi:hypothetical protein